MVLLAGMSWKSYDPNEWAKSKVSLPVLLFCLQPSSRRQVPRGLDGHGAPEPGSMLWDGWEQLRVLPRLRRAEPMSLTVLVLHGLGALQPF